METWDAIRARRNIRDYQDRLIPPPYIAVVLVGQAEGRSRP